MFKKIAKAIAPEVSRNGVGTKIRIRFAFLCNKSHRKEDLGIGLFSDPVEADAAAKTPSY